MRKPRLQFVVTLHSFADEDDEKLFIEQMYEIREVAAVQVYEPNKTEEQIRSEERGKLQKQMRRLAHFMNVGKDFVVLPEPRERKKPRAKTQLQCVNCRKEKEQ